MKTFALDKYGCGKGRADLMSDEWILDRVQALGLIKEEA